MVDTGPWSRRLASSSTTARTASWTALLLACKPGEQFSPCDKSEPRRSPPPASAGPPFRAQTSSVVELRFCLAAVNPSVCHSPEFVHAMCEEERVVEPCATVAPAHD